MYNNALTEIELYEPMREWLEKYIKDKCWGYDVIAVDAHSERLDKVLSSMGINCDVANGVDIQIDVVGVAKSGARVKLFFIEAKKTRLTLRDLGQLWAYCKLIDPEEAFLMSSSGLGSLNRVLNGFNREDILDYGDGKRIKKMKVSKWDLKSRSPDFASMIPKI